jgi:Fe-S cluster assembly ATP-binding protein
MLSIQNLTTKVGDKVIISDINLVIKSATKVLIQGHNGSGKSTFAQTIARSPFYGYSGSVTFDNIDVLSLPCFDLISKGIFVSFQNPVEIQGLNLLTFLKEIINNNQTKLNQESYSSKEIIEMVNQNLELLGLDKTILKRALNDNFSGGEKKKIELLQMLLLKPKLIVLDEIDSGVDIESTRKIFQIIENYDKSATKIIISHNPNILEYYKPDQVVRFEGGNIIQ